MMGSQVGRVVKSRGSSSTKTMVVSSFRRGEAQLFDGSGMMVERVARRWKRIRDVLGSL